MSGGDPEFSDFQRCDDPRVFWAAERTLLAWIRTAIAMMGFGFVVARFGLFLREMRLLEEPAAVTQPRAGIALYVGVALVALGVLISILSATEHMGLCRNMDPKLRRMRRRSSFAIATSFALALIGIALGYNIMTTIR